jgi:hypothetical protein
LVLATLLTGTNAALGPWSLNKASLGAFTTDATGVINIYVQSPMVDYTDADIKPTGWDPTNISTSVGPNANQRTEFDGVGYQLVQPSSLPGDFDSDGDVDGADFVAWQTNFPTGNSATTSQGDADGDGDVDGADFAAWQANFPVAPSSGTVSVPEPTSCALAVIACLGAWRFRRRRPRRDRSRGWPLGNW